MKQKYCRETCRLTGGWSSRKAVVTQSGRRAKRSSRKAAVVQRGFGGGGIWRRGCSLGKAISLGGDRAPVRCTEASFGLCPLRFLQRRVSLELLTAKPSAPRRRYVCRLAIRGHVKVMDGPLSTRDVQPPNARHPPRTRPNPRGPVCHTWLTLRVSWAALQESHFRWFDVCPKRCTADPCCTSHDDAGASVTRPLHGAPSPVPRR